MIKSMTGYGRGEATFNGRKITVEVRSVNNRYLDCGIKLPRIYIFAEDAIKGRVQSCVTRGKVDVFITIDSAGADQGSIAVNQPVADGYYAALAQLRDTYQLRDDISVSLLSRFPGCVFGGKDRKRIWSRWRQISARCWTVHCQTIMSCANGRVTVWRQDILEPGICASEELTGRVEERSPQRVAEYRSRLEAKMAEVLAEYAVGREPDFDRGCNFC